ncbi:MAG: helix-turn-helix transcriptional regulator [Bacteroidales bacterium]|nr:helix-turn-helix transcriptional regulator [Bacteroidales bacterium]
MNDQFDFSTNYTIPVYFDIEDITNRTLEGVIVIKKGYLPYLKVNSYNKDDLIPVKEQTKVKMIYCHQKEAGKTLLLINNIINPIDSMIGYMSSFKIYFDFIINSAGNINKYSDLSFYSVILSFENLYKWTNILHKKNLKEHVLFRSKINNMYSNEAEISIFKTIQYNKNDNTDSRFSIRENDTKIEIRFIKNKLNLDNVKKIIRDLESLLTCISGKSCFCLDATITKLKGKSKYKNKYNLFVSNKTSEPIFDMDFYAKSFHPFILQYKTELTDIFNNYFKSRDVINDLMYKISSTILYKNRFLYDLKFHYICTLIETANKICIKQNDKIQINNTDLFNAIESVIKNDDISKTIVNSIPFLLNGTFGKKIRNLENYQYPDCKIINFTNPEITYIVKNRNLLSHGESPLDDRNISFQSIMEKMTILLLYTIWKYLGLTSEIIKNNILRSFASFQFPIDDELIKYEKYDKIYLSHKQFNKAMKFPQHSFMVIEKVGDQYIFNNRYTEYLQKDHHFLNYYSYIGNYLKCYYNQTKITFNGYKQNVYLINKNSITEKKLFSQYYLISINDENPSTAYFADNTLVPMEVYKNYKPDKMILKAYREYRKMTINELAKKAILSISTIEKYENEYHPANKETYRKILKALGTDLFIDNTLR